MPGADIGGAGAVFIALETAYGTAVDPSLDDSTGVWMPILSESLAYTEPDRYYSEQIRQEAVHSDVKQSYYHAEGDIVFEVDANYLPYLLYASRHTVSKSGAGPFDYSAVPSKVGATYPGGTAKGASITVIRNGEGFMYNGCVVNQWAFTVENGVLRCTASILGLGESDVDDDAALTPTWVAPALFGADAHAISVDAAGTAPAFAAPDATFNGFTFTANHNGEAQNRIVRDRSATYVKYGISEISYDTELDFVSKAEYNNFKNLNLRAVRFESIIPGGVAGTYAAATKTCRITVYRTNYATYEVGLSGMGDLVMARVTGRGLGITGGSAYKIECRSPVNIT